MEAKPTRQDATQEGSERNRAVVELAAESVEAELGLCTKEASDQDLLAGFVELRELMTATAGLPVCDDV
jgi:hypothetical protein